VSGASGTVPVVPVVPDALPEIPAGPVLLRPWRPGDAPAVRWGFAALSLDRVELVHAVDNPASGRVAQKAGFTREGRLRRSHRYADGIRRDELLWARLSDDDVPDLSTRS